MCGDEGEPAHHRSDPGFPEMPWKPDQPVRRTWEPGPQSEDDRQPHERQPHEVDEQGGDGRPHDREESSDQRSGKPVPTITRSALASSVTRTGVRPRISPSTSSARGGSVSTHTSLVVRNRVRASGRRGPMTVWRTVARLSPSPLGSPSRYTTSRRLSRPASGAIARPAWWLPLAMLSWWVASWWTSSP